MHFDNVDHGDVVISLTVENDGTVLIEPAEGGPTLRASQRAGDFYVLYGAGLRDGRHGVRAGRSGRVSLTLRFIKRPRTTFEI